MRVLLSVTLMMLVLANAAAAHDFWIQPNAFATGASQNVSFALLVGHGPDRQRSPIPARRVIRYEHWSPNGARNDLLADLQTSGGFLQSQATFSQQGLH